MHTLLRANWTSLLSATFEADRNLLNRFIPPKTELSDWNGKYYMSLVGFLFQKPSLLRIPIPFYRNFPEINLRFYVRHKSRYGWRNGVVFIREIAPSRLIAMAANLMYGEDFISLPMNYCLEKTKELINLKYEWQIGKENNHIQIVCGATPREPGEADLTYYLREHYFAYSVNNDRCREFQIEHDKWNVFPARSFGMKVDTETLYGKEFVGYFKEAPVSSFYMDGSRTKVSFPSFI
jgi:uncharacterized protein YqjF (DUF2071 family)